MAAQAVAARPSMIHTQELHQAGILRPRAYQVPAGVQTGASRMLTALREFLPHRSIQLVAGILLPQLLVSIAQPHYRIDLVLLGQLVGMRFCHRIDWPPRAPLLEPERHTLLNAHIPHPPRRTHRHDPRPRPALPARYHPVDLVIPLPNPRRQVHRLQ